MRGRRSVCLVSLIAGFCLSGYCSVGFRDRVHGVRRRALSCSMAVPAFVAVSVFGGMTADLSPGHFGDVREHMSEHVLLSCAVDALMHGPGDFGFPVCPLIVLIV